MSSHFYMKFMKQTNTHFYMKFMNRAFGEFHKFHMKWSRVLLQF